MTNYLTGWYLKNCGIIGSGYHHVEESSVIYDILTPKCLVAQIWLFMKKSKRKDLWYDVFIFVGIEMFSLFTEFN